MKQRRSKGAKIIATGLRSDGLLEQLSGKPQPSYELRLYIAGSNLNSTRAIEHVRDLCVLLRPSECRFEIIDLYQQPGLAKRDEIVAAPALVKISPPPSRTFIGDLTDTAKVLTGLGITTAKIQDVRRKSKGQ
jgi:circadian clock protein KaiB